MFKNIALAIISLFIIFAMIVSAPTISKNSTNNLVTETYKSCFVGNDYQPNACKNSDKIDMYEDGSYIILATGETGQVSLNK
jgi:hypothetical protein